MTDEEKKAQEIQEKTEREAKEKAAKESAAKEEADKLAASKKAEDEAAGQKSPLEEARELDESIKERNVETKKLLDRQEKMLADAQIAGKGFAGQAPQTKKELTDVEYSEALEKGQVNPLKEDGII